MIRSALEKWLARHPMPDAFPSKEAKAAYLANMPADVRNEWAVRKASKECLDPEFNAGTAARARERMMRVDEFPPDVRAMVYEFGLEIIQEFWNHGVRKSKSIKHLIETVRGEYQDGTPRFKVNKGRNTKRNPAEFDDEYWSAK